MDQLRIEIEQGGASFEPGQELRGSVNWSFDEQPKALALRLFWYTKGKGTQDVNIVTRERFESPGLYDTRKFSFRLPKGPYSFSGKLISLIWALELVVEPSGKTERTELVVGPGNSEVQLYS